VREIDDLVREIDDLVREIDDLVREIETIEFVIMIEGPGILLDCCSALESTCGTFR